MHFFLLFVASLLKHILISQHPQGYQASSCLSRNICPSPKYNLAWAQRLGTLIDKKKANQMLANKERHKQVFRCYVPVLTLWSRSIHFLLSLSHLFVCFKRQILNCSKNKEVIELSLFLYALQLQEKQNIALGQSSVKIHRVLNSFTFSVHHLKLCKQQMGIKGHFIPF